MKKRISIFLTKRDEAVFSVEIKKIFPKVSFVDEFDLEKEQPIEKDSIADCESKFIQIWNKELYPVFEKYVRGDAEIPNPPTLLWIHMIRASHLDPTTLIIPKENSLSSGTLSVAIYEDDHKWEEMLEFVNEVWKILRKITTKKISVVSLETGIVINNKPFNTVAGKDAIVWCKSDPKRYFKFHSVQVYLKPSL